MTDLQTPDVVAAVAAPIEEPPSIVEPHIHYCHKHDDTYECRRMECVPHAARTCNPCRTDHGKRKPKKEASR